METSNIYIYFLQLSAHLPTIIVYLIGIGFAVFNYAKNPKVSILSALAFAILLFIAFLAPALTPLIIYLQKYGYDNQIMGYITFGISLILSIIGTISFALLIGAIWKDRGSR